MPVRSIISFSFSIEIPQLFREEGAGGRAVGKETRIVIKNDLGKKKISLNSKLAMLFY